MAAKALSPEQSERALQLFLAGATYPQIASALTVDAAAIHDTVCAALAGSADRRVLLSDNAPAVNQERTEALFRAHWGAALSGDHKSAELCRRILERQAMSMNDTAKPEGDSVDEIAARRSARRAGSPARKTRAAR